jgi:hypothetical protein
MRGENWARVGTAKLCRRSAMAWRAWFKAMVKAPIRLTLKAWIASGANRQRQKLVGFLLAAIEQVGVSGNSPGQ